MKTELEQIDINKDNYREVFEDINKQLSENPKNSVSGIIVLIKNS